MGAFDLSYQLLLNRVLEQGDIHEDTSRDIMTSQLASYHLDLTNYIGIPILTTKKIYFKSVFTELEFFIKGMSNIKFLIDNNCNIWNKDAYAFYIRLCEVQKIKTKLKFDHFVELIKSGNQTDLPLPEDYNLGDLGPVYGNQWHKNDQFKNVLDNLIDGNFNRRLLVNGWNPQEIKNMALPPCHWSWEVLKYKDGFIVKWHQRSVDTFLGLPFNMLSYHTLGSLLGLIANRQFYGIIGDLSNVHIYENHIDAIEKQLSNSPYEYSNRDFKYSFPGKIYNIAAQYRDKAINFDDLIQQLDVSRMSIKNYKSFPAIPAEMLAPKP